MLDLHQLANLSFARRACALCGFFSNQKIIKNLESKIQRFIDGIVIRGSIKVFNPLKRVNSFYTLKKNFVGTIEKDVSIP
jgi:hypothetical protein